MGVLPATAFRAARALRERSISLWPQGSQGRRQEAHVTVGHCVNLALAIATADPMTDAPNTVRRYRSLVEGELRIFDHDRRDTPRVTRECVATPGVGTLAPLFSNYGNTLGKHLEGLLMALSDTGNQAQGDLRHVEEFELEITVGPLPQAVLVFDLWTGDAGYRTERQTYTPPRPVQAAPGMVTVKTIPFSVFEVMAALPGPVSPGSPNRRQGDRGFLHPDDAASRPHVQG